MPRVKTSDLLGVLKGVQSVTNALIKHQEDTIRYRIIHSSLRNLPEKCLQAVGEKLNNTEPSKVPVSFAINIHMNVILCMLPSIKIILL